jgi:YegS/Rv2252/BmrU family lipid kinase
MSTFAQPQTWMVILNPNAGNRKAAKDWPNLSRLLKKHNVAFEYLQTQHKGHAIELTNQAIARGFRNFLAIGGDGTLNEVVNGIFGQSIPISDFKVAMIPVGTGNDWCRTFKIPFDYVGAIKLVADGNTFRQDVGLVSYFDNTQRLERHFVNIAGMGYDAEVALKTNNRKDQGKGGPLSYLISLFTSLLYYKFTKITVTTDQESYACKAFSLSVGICKFNGGGMKQLPNAIPNDGIFDATLIKKIGKFTVITQLKNLYDGSFITHPKIKTFTGTTFHIESDPAVLLEVDGESMGHSPFEFKILPTCLNVVVPKGITF